MFLYYCHTRRKAQWKQAILQYLFTPQIAQSASPKPSPYHESKQYKLIHSLLHQGSSVQVIFLTYLIMLLSFVFGVTRIQKITLEKSMMCQVIEYGCCCCLHLQAPYQHRILQNITSDLQTSFNNYLQIACNHPTLTNIIIFHFYAQRLLNSRTFMLT